MKIYLVIFVVFLMAFSNNSLASDPKLLVKAEVPALMQTAEHLSKLADNISPGASAQVAVGVLALTFNPHFQALALTRPIYAYAYETGCSGKHGVEWCVVVEKKGKKVPKKIKV